MSPVNLLNLTPWEMFSLAVALIIGWAATVYLEIKLINIPITPRIIIGSFIFLCAIGGTAGLIDTISLSIYLHRSIPTMAQQVMVFFIFTVFWPLPAYCAFRNCA
jgi:hypothetical protein